MSPDNLSALQVGLEVLNVLVLPALFGIGRWMMRIELRLSRIEWAAGAKPEDRP